MQKIINLSIQWNPWEELPREILEEVTYAALQGVITVAAAGNFGPALNTLSPIAKLPFVISVGAATNDGCKLADFSSRGFPGKLDNHPTVVAPGFDPTANFNSLQKSLGGTSLATAVVTGIVARIVSARQSLGLSYSINVIKAILEDMARPMHGYEQFEVGAGFVNEEIAEVYLRKKIFGK